MTTCSRVRHIFARLSIFALLALGAPLLAQTEDPPVIDAPPPAEAEPVVDVDPPASEPEAASEPPAERPAELTQQPAAPGVAGPISAPSAAAQPPLPSTPPPPYVTTEVVPVTGGPAAVVPNASGTPIVIQPPVIEPPEVIDEPWTVARAIPWLIAGLLIGGSLALLLFRERKRRRLVRYEVERLRTISGDPPVTQPAVAPAQPHPVAPNDGVQVLVRKVGHPKASDATRAS